MLLDNSLQEQKLLSDSDRFPLLHSGLRSHALHLLPIQVLVDILATDAKDRCWGLGAGQSEFV